MLLLLILFPIIFYDNSLQIKLNKLEKGFSENNRSSLLLIELAVVFSLNTLKFYSFKEKQKLL